MYIIRLFIDKLPVLSYNLGIEKKRILLNCKEQKGVALGFAIKLALVSQGIPNLAVNYSKEKIGISKKFIRNVHAECNHF